MQDHRTHIPKTNNRATMMNHSTKTTTCTILYAVAALHSHYLTQSFTPPFPARKQLTCATTSQAATTRYSRSSNKDGEDANAKANLSSMIDDLEKRLSFIDDDDDDLLHYGDIRVVSSTDSSDMNMNLDMSMNMDVGVDMNMNMNDLDLHHDEPTEEELLALESEIETLLFNHDDDVEEGDSRSEVENSQQEQEGEQSELNKQMREAAARGVERALMAGVVPASAGVGSGCLPGDYGFDPLNLATRDYIQSSQDWCRRILKYIPSLGDEDDGVDKDDEELTDKPRPAALILRDYREAEIRHGRIAMLAAIIWPLQEITDRLFMPDKFGDTTFIYGGVTLPFLSLLMTFMMLNLGYLDIFSQAIKENQTGDAFLPGECFWDPLCILEGAPDDMKSNMQLRELNNGRFAMMAVAAFILEEAITHKPVISLPLNMYLFEPIYEVPAVQEWLDLNFSERIM